MDRESDPASPLLGAILNLATFHRDHEKFYAFAGFKTATIIQPEQVLNPGGESEVEVGRVGETNYGFLGGAGFDPHENIRFDIGGGYFQACYLRGWRATHDRRAAVLESTRAHTAYNLAIVSLLLVAIVLTVAGIG